MSGRISYEEYGEMVFHLSIEEIDKLEQIRKELDLFNGDQVVRRLIMNYELASEQKK